MGNRLRVFELTSHQSRDAIAEQTQHKPDLALRDRSRVQQGLVHQDKALAWLFRFTN